MTIGEIYNIVSSFVISGFFWVWWFPLLACMGIIAAVTIVKSIVRGR